MDQTIYSQIAVLEKLITKETLELRNTKVSGWSVGQHIDHILKTSIKNLARLLNSVPEGKGGINMLGRAILIVGRIPRGRAKAPAGLEGEELPIEVLQAKLFELRSLVSQIEKRGDLLSSSIPFAKHAFFGVLSSKQWFKFMRIHNDHHLRIIKDIAR